MPRKNADGDLAPDPSWEDAYDDMQEEGVEENKEQDEPSQQEESADQTPPVSKSGATKMSATTGKTTGAGSAGKRDVHLDTNAGEGEDDKLSPYLSVTEKMQQRGEAAIDAESLNYTNVKMEFSVGKDDTEYPIRQAVMDLMRKIQQVDKKFAMQQTDGNNKWKEPSEIPTGDEFTEQLVVQQIINARNAVKIEAHCTFISKLRFNNLKFAKPIFNYIKEKDIYVKYDHFDTKTTGSPGFLINVHPTLTNKMDIGQDIEAAMEGVDVDDKPAARKWKRENAPGWGDETNPIPKFTLHATKRKFGNGPDKVSTEVLAFECAASDAAYLKALLVKAYESDDMEHGQFVPTGLHLAADVETFVGLLQRQNKYLARINVATIEGITHNAMWQPILLNGTNTTLGEYLIGSETLNILQVEKTRRTAEIGKWFILYDKDHSRQIRNLIESTLPLIYNEQIRTENKLEGYMIPRRPGQEQGSSMSSYIEALRGLVGTDNPQTADDSGQYNNAPPNTRKRRAIALTTAEFPQLPTPRAAHTTQVKTNVTQTDQVSKAQYQTDMEKMRSDLRQEMKQIATDIVKEATTALKTEFERSLKEQLVNVLTDIRQTHPGLLGGGMQPQPSASTTPPQMMQQQQIPHGNMAPPASQPMYSHVPHPTQQIPMGHHHGYPPMTQPSPFPYTPGGSVGSNSTDLSQSGKDSANQE